MRARLGNVIDNRETLQLELIQASQGVDVPDKDPAQFLLSGGNQIPVLETDAA